MGCTLCPPTCQIHPAHKYPIYSLPSLLFFPQSSPRPSPPLKPIPISHLHIHQSNPLNPNTPTNRPTQQPVSRFKGRLHRSLYLSITNNPPKCEMASDHHAPAVTSPVLPHQQRQDLPDLCSTLSHSSLTLIQLDLLTLCCLSHLPGRTTNLTVHNSAPEYTG